MKKAKKKATKTIVLDRKKLSILGVSVAFVLLVLLFGYFGFEIYFLNRVYPSTYFAGKNVGGMTDTQISQLVSRDIDSFIDSTTKLQLESNDVSINHTEINLIYNKERTTKKILASGKTNSFLARLKYILGKNTVSADYSLDLNKLNSTLQSKFGLYEKMPVDSTIEFVGNSIQIRRPQDGKLVNRGLLFKSLNNNFANLSSEPISLDVVVQKPSITEDNAQEAYKRAVELSKQQVVFNYGYDTWTLSGNNLLNLLSFYRSNQGSEHLISFDFNSPFYIDQVSLQDRADEQLDVSFDDVKFDSYLSTLAKVIDKPTRDATLQFENGKVVEFSSAQDGQILDRDLTREITLKKLSVESNSREERIVVQLPVKVTKAKIANDQINSLGIKELIGSGVSYFAGSIPNRVSNIILGSSLINGALVKPGDVFSFDALVGPVSKEQGFKQAYVINSGRTVLDDGGGICQVSTTVFRAALNTGLPILKRTAHAYRVGYYEQHGFKPGLDATIFSPSVDLQFKNDTEHTILVQTTVDKANSRLQVDIYGTLDGRKVIISDPVVSNIKPAPEPLYQDDPTLPTGTLKQVDFAAAGATSIFTRKVYKNGQLVIDDVFKSNFRPWQAVFLVGKG